jgi:hypothetical protein
MKRSYQIWLLAIIITVGSAVYQRLTGPTHPKHYVTLLNSKAISVTLDRAHAGDGNHVVSVTTNDEAITGTVEWKRFNTGDEFTAVPMTYRYGILTAELPHQPPAGKLNYKVILTDGKETFTAVTVIRFRGDVPATVLILHVIFMFTGMLLAARTGLEVFLKEPNLRRLTDLTLIALTIGGMMLGPLVQQYAFNEWWTGFPYGHDLTDNKTLIAFIAWIVAAVAVRKARQPKWWVLGAAVITLLIFLIPHSVWGSELDYSTMQLKQ